VTRCAGCGHDNRDGRRFCAGCGGALEAPCGRCGFGNLAGERFCGGCGAALGAVHLSERRTVAILFADLAGYTRLSATLDPEETHRLLTGFFEVVDGACTRFGGTIDKHIGDNVMAIFGAPVAHGDDPERAVRAAVAIHHGVAGYARRVGRDLAVHVGIAYGEVIASGLGSSHHREYTVTGDAVNLAARLQDQAVGGETMISEAVYRAAAKIAVAEPGGDVVVKGLAEPVRVWKLVDVQAPSRAEALVGRDAELAAIGARLAPGALIVVRGDPGIGKSTLAAEAARRAAGAGFAVHAAHVVDFGAGRGAGAIPTLVASLVGGDLDAAVAADRVAAADAPHLASLLERDAADRDDLDDRDRRDRQHAAFTRLIAGCPAPPLVVVEDVHWADAVTEQRLRHAVGGAAAVLVTTRIDGDPIDAEWRAAARDVVELDLEPLAAEHAVQIAEGHLRDAELVARCVERAGGNPLFLEQLVHAAAGDAVLPGTLMGVVLARVDRLASRDKAALQAAAIAGQRFDLGLVRHLAGDPTWAPDEVVARRLVRATATELGFHHALILDAIYASITHARRRDLHRAAAAFYADRDAELHAEHLERAGDPAAAAAWLAASERHAAVHDVERDFGLI
jgi:class 3 adenylate cyclase